MQQYFGEKNLKKYDLTSSMAEKGSTTLNSRRFGVWHGKKGDIEKLFLLLLLPFFRWQEKLKPFNCSVKAISVLTKAKTKNIHEFKYRKRKSVNG